METLCNHGKGEEACMMTSGFPENGLGCICLLLSCQENNRHKWRNQTVLPWSSKGRGKWRSGELQADGGHLLWTDKNHGWTLGACEGNKITCRALKCGSGEPPQNHVKDFLSNSWSLSKVGGLSSLGRGPWRRVWEPGPWCFLLCIPGMKGWFCYVLPQSMPLQTQGNVPELPRQWAKLNLSAL